MGLSSLVQRGIDNASDETLARMYAQYNGEAQRSDLSPRDVEARTMIIAKLRTVASARGVELDE